MTRAKKVLIFKEFKIKIYFNTLAKLNIIVKEGGISIKGGL